MVAAVAGLAIAAASLAAAIPELGAQEAEKSAVFLQPTYSSPIALSRDNRLLWSVNPADNSVSVVRTDTNTVLRKIKVGREPQSVALDPNNKFAFVANAAGSSVSVIQINNPSYGAFCGLRRQDADDRRRALEHRDLAQRQARLRGQQRPGHDHRDQCADPEHHRPCQSCAAVCATSRAAISSRAGWR